MTCFVLEGASHAKSRRNPELQQGTCWRPQVRLAVPEGDDFERCAIEIWVKFRDEEELQRLSSHRQSGGERSVSTILYLIAIQARLSVLAGAPHAPSFCASRKCARSGCGSHLP